MPPNSAEAERIVLPGDRFAKPAGVVVAKANFSEDPPEARGRYACSTDEQTVENQIRELQQVPHLRLGGQPVPGLEVARLDHGEDAVVDLLGNRAALERAAAEFGLGARPPRIFHQLPSRSSSLSPPATQAP
jgi:hypothetical protein